MDLSEIQSLIKFVAKSGVNEVELETKDFKINIKSGKDEAANATMQMPGYPVMPAMAPQPQAVAPAPQPAPQPAAAPASAPAKADESANKAADDDSKYVTFKSPMIGTFYRSSSPESPAFVNVGDEVKPDSVICIIEAMKLFNEIEAEVSGKIVKVLVDDATPVEYDQPLFLIDPA